MPHSRTGLGVVSILIGTITLVLCAFAGAEPVIVHLKDGRQIEGELVEQTDERVVLLVVGERQSYPVSQVQRVEKRQSVMEEYRQRREKLADDDVNGRYELALWLFSQGAHDLALAELEELKTLAPDDDRVARLHESAEAQVRLEEENRPAGAAGNSSARQLTREQINLIKVFEVDLSNRPAIQIPRKVIDTILERYQDDSELRGEASRREFRAERGYDQLDKMFDLAQRYPEVREFYKDVVVQRDPPALSTFRNFVHRTYVINYCGTVGCHGGPNAGEFQLVTEKSTSEQTAYTNFYLLNAWPYEGEQDGDPQGPPPVDEPGDLPEGQRRAYRMIDRVAPQGSLLVQYGLPRDEAASPHPDVPNWRPRFRRLSDSTAMRIIDWIDDLYRPAPDYMIDFRLPEPAAPEEEE